MPKRLMLVVAVAFVVISAVGTTIAIGQSGSSSTSRNILTARLSGNNENPKADLNGRGAAAVVISGNRVCLSIAYARLSTVAAAHIHRGGRGVNGPIVVDPKFTGGPGARGTLGRCVTPNAGTRVSDIRNNPGGYYVNVHSSQFPGGAIRGQLSSK
jgi:hypothetical protein